MRPVPHNNAYTGGEAFTPRLRPLVPSGAFMREWDIIRHEELDSTNLEAARLVAAGLRCKSIIIAGAQTNGQCRHKRLWESKGGKGLWASFVLPVSAPRALLPQSTLVLAVAVREGICAATGIFLETKWPNDLLDNGKKCCGLLVESCSEFHFSPPAPLILGVGVNCNHSTEDFPQGLRGAATSLRLLAGGVEVDREQILRAVTGSIGHWFAVWERHGFSRVRNAWFMGNCTIGKKVILPDGYGYHHATAEDLDETGALLALADDGTALLIDSGEIRFSTDQNGRVSRTTQACGRPLAVAQAVPGPCADAPLFP